MLKLSLLFCILSPHRSEALTPRFSGSWSEAEESWLDRAAARFEPQLSPAVGGSFLIRKLERGERSAWLGESNPGEIHLRWTDDASARESVLRHEMTHIWLSKLCGARVGQAPVASEAFAQFLSGDMNRIAAAKSEFAYFADAQAYLKKTSFATSPRDKFEKALARILVQLEERPREQLKKLAGELKDCRDLPRIQGDLESLLLNGKSLQADHRLRIHVDALWMNLESKETLFSEGRIEQRRPVGSTLKPFFVDRSVELMRPQVAKAGWHCPGEPGRLWQWPEALSYSCNDFFLSSAARVPSKELAEVVGQPLGILNTAEMIGLVPTVKLSLTELAAVYSDLYERQSFVWPALQKTLTSGTLEGIAGGSEFQKWGASAKTGTVQTTDGVVQMKYLVLYLPKGSRWPAAHLLLLRGEGVSEKLLMARALSIVARSPSPVTSSVQVSILSLLRDQALDLSCESGSLQKVGETSKCLVGPLMVSTRSRSGRPIKKKYFGSLTHQNSQPQAKSKLPLTERQALARTASQWILRTSARQYVAQTLISEAGGMQIETLRALGPIVLANARESEVNGQPICDSSLCQVFNAVPSSRTQLERYLSIANEVASSEVHCEPQKFYLGGQQNWSKHFDLATAAEALKVSKIYSVSSRQDRVEINGESAPCEMLRGSLHFLSCPAEFALNGSELVISGQGEGHGEGLNLLEANRLALQGATAAEIRAKLLR